MENLRKRNSWLFLLAGAAALIILLPALAGGDRGGAGTEPAQSDLEAVLSEIRGVGSVKVYRQDAGPDSESGMFSLSGYFGGGSGASGDTPSEGILVVAEGAGDPRIRSELARILSGVLQLPEHRIVVVEMKKEGEGR
ncbi:hypothetical protein [Bhargavaea cecembensis]|uniref:hypothetical protein n=1 Tax=Bhargavaea cecembensis TaxID=394098 RepID=UPI00058B20DB|nr:hypothetical protein [Bhargavaea cecembensis]